MLRVMSQRSFFGISVGEKIWKPPKEGTFQVDVDACFDVEKLLFGVGMVIRDSRGEVRAAMEKPITNPGSILEAELIAMLYGLGLSLQEDLGPMVLFSDSILAVHSVSKMTKRGAEIMECFDEFVELINQEIILEICHMYREANRVAHSLARFGTLHSCMFCWSSHFPQWLREVVKLDMK